MKESDLQRLLKNYLEAMGWFVIRMNSGAVPITSKQGKTYRVRLARAGTPDLLAFKDHKFGDPGVDLLFIEVKLPKNKPTFAQEQMAKELTEKGARVLTIHSLEELQASL